MVTSIDVGTVAQKTKDGDQVFYKAVVKLNETSLKSKNDVIKSIPVEARIVYEKETYMDWILKQLNFRN